MTGCNHSYVGESHHWKGDMSIKKFNGKLYEVFTFVYENQSPIKDYQVTLEVGDSVVRQREDDLNDTKISIKRLLRDSDKNLKKIPVTIKWGNKEEKFKLKKE